MIDISKLRCTDCGGQGDLIVFWPGRDGQQAAMFRLTRSVPEKCWCAECWQKRYTPQPAPPRSGGKAKKRLITQD